MLGANLGKLLNIEKIIKFDMNLFLIGYIRAFLKWF